MSDTTTLAEALLSAQADMPKVEPDATNPHFKSRFVSLGHLLAKVRPVLNKHGLTVIQLPARGDDGFPVLRTTILHKSGEKVEADAPLMLPKQDPQGQGSAITYMRRYALAAALAISDQEDDDGNAASGPEKNTISRERAVALNKARTIDHKALGLAFGSVGANAPTGDTNEARAEAFLALTTEQADKLEPLLTDGE